jgi:hypothetical protein
MAIRQRDLRLPKGNTSSLIDDAPAAAAGPGVNRLFDLLAGKPLPPPFEVYFSVEKYQVYFLLCFAFLF